VPPLPVQVRDRLRSLAQSFVPETASASEAEWRELEARIEAALASRPPAMRRQLALFVRVLDTAARIRYLGGLSRLDPPQRTALLEWFSRSPLLSFRRGIWGLRTLVMLGWYTQPSVQSAVGYRATPAGWDARR
jgi:hypothetical protein